MAPALVIFLHIPKTAGMAFKKACHKAVRKRLLWFHGKSTEFNKRSRIRHVTDFENFDPRKLAEYRMLGGHIRFHKLPKEVLDLRPTFIAVMRDPVARALSYYSYIQ